jgi:hypothetical protein
MQCGLPGNAGKLMGSSRQGNSVFIEKNSHNVFGSAGVKYSSHKSLLLTRRYWRSVTNDNDFRTRIRDITF